MDQAGFLMSGALAHGWSQRKAFFFEKKKQKTFITLELRCNDGRRQSPAKCARVAASACRVVPVGRNSSPIGPA